MGKEIELKFPLHDAEELLARLSSFGECSEKVQKDTYYVPAHRNFVKQDPIKEWLRIRETKDGVRLNYKHWHDLFTETVHCDESETDVEDVEALREIFSKLDFEEIIVVEKVRKSWLKDDVEISVDSVTGLGDFIELECKKEFDSVEEAKDHLYSVLKEIKAEVGERDFKGYPHLLLEKAGLLQQ